MEIPAQNKALTPLSHPAHAVSLYSQYRWWDLASLFVINAGSGLAFPYME